MRFVNPFSRIMSIFLQTTASPRSLPPRTPDRPCPCRPRVPVKDTPLSAPRAREHPRHERTLVPASDMPASPPRTARKTVPDRDEHAIPSPTGTTHKTVPGRDEHAIPSVPGTKHHIVPGRDKKAPRPQHSLRITKRVLRAVSPKPCWERVRVWERENPASEVEGFPSPKNSSPASKRKKHIAEPPSFAVHFPYGKTTFGTACRYRPYARPR